MPKQHPFVRDDVFPSWFANAVQELLSCRPIKLRHYSTTAVACVVGVGEQRGLPIMGRWRYRTATVSQAVTGAAGARDIYATASETNIASVPDPYTDTTDYTFGLAIVGAGATPAVNPGVVDVFEKIGSLYWDGSKITRLFQDVGEKPAGLCGDFVWMAGPTDGTHPLPADRLPADGGLSPIASYPGLFGAVGHAANGGVDPGGGQFRRPDGRGRVLVAQGSHSEVATVGASENGAVAKATDEGNLAARRPRHTHTVASHAHSDGTLAAAAHQHQHVSPIGLRAGFMELYNPSVAALDWNGSTYSFMDVVNDVMIEMGGGGGGNTAERYVVTSTAVGADVSGATGSAAPATDAQGSSYLVGTLAVYV